MRKPQNVKRADQLPPPPSQLSPRHETNTPHNPLNSTPGALFSCCCPTSVDAKQKPFLGHGTRLGTEPTESLSGIAPAPDPAPALNPAITAADRYIIRAERATAAESRQLGQTPTKKKKKKKKTSAPLRVPNSDNLLRWACESAP